MAKRKADQNLVPSPKRAPIERPWLAPPWQPGQSGNPTGFSGLYGEVVKMAREATPEAMRTLIGLLQCDDDRVRAVAANAIFDRAWGKPKDYDPKHDAATPKLDFSRLTNEEVAQMRALLVRAVKEGE